MAMQPLTARTDTWTITFARPRGTDPAEALHYALDAMGEWATRWDEPESAIRIIGSGDNKEYAANLLLDSCLLITKNDILGPPKVTPNDIDPRTAS